MIIKHDSIKQSSIHQAMILAAGLGSRMRPLTEKIPKPLVKIAGRTMLDRVLDQCNNAGINHIVINVHHLAQHIENHLKDYKNIIISDERETLLDSAGGIVKALPHFNNKPFFIFNADTFFIDHDKNILQKMADSFDPKIMDILLLTTDLYHTTGVEYADFSLLANSMVERAKPKQKQGVVYAGVAILNPAIFDKAKIEPHSLNLYFNKAITQNRLYTLALNGHLYTIGTMAQIEIAEALIQKRGE